MLFVLYAKKTSDFFSYTQNRAWNENSEFRVRKQSLSMTGTGAELIWMGYEVFLRIFDGV